MEALRKNDNLERRRPPIQRNPVEYGWRDILMEELRLSRAEHKLLTNYDHDPPLNLKLTLQQLYGFAPATPEADAVADPLERERLLAPRRHLVRGAHRDPQDALRQPELHADSQGWSGWASRSRPQGAQGGTITSDEFGTLLPLDLILPRTAAISRCRRR